MKDFQFWPGLTYQKSCKVARQVGLIPLDELDAELERELRQTVSDVLPKVRFFEADFEIDGIFAYRASDQQGDYEKNTLALCYQSGEHSAVIGMSSELFELTRPLFWRVVFCHELGHLCGTIGHAEQFNLRFSKILFDLFGQPEQRFDSLDTQQRMINTISVFNW